MRWGGRDIEKSRKRFYKSRRARASECYLTHDESRITSSDNHMSPRYIGDNHKLALLLDYDGTLAPIATHPDLAILPLETKNVLQRLSNMSDVYIAIISGRNVINVKSMVGIEGITYAGNHGLEILHPDGSKFVHPMPAELEDKVASLMQTLQEQVLSTRLLSILVI